MTDLAVVTVNNLLEMTELYFIGKLLSRPYKP
jgi:hypothetical protein